MLCSALCGCVFTRLVTASFPKNHYTHIFIDEGAHAIEPECIVPISGLMDPSDKEKCSQLVVAGDPKQLGPILRSPIVLFAGLGNARLLSPVFTL